MDSKLSNRNKWVEGWLLAGVIMVFVQILLGGVTRLTGSGLSITRWDIVTGTIPPLNEADWNEAFELYRSTPQYQKINKGMEMSQFKFIFFWEYIHRLWARSMGFVFLFPFVYFLYKKWLKKETIRRLMVVVFLAALAALFGWIMVASGLIHRPWVSAYKLTIHLGLGISLFIFLWYTWMKERAYSVILVSRGWKRATSLIVGLLIIQICFGGFVSGMKSALNYPTWPTMNREWIPSILFDQSHWNINAVLMYDQSGFMPALVQFIHRNLAYLITVTVFLYCLNWIKIRSRNHHWIAYGLLGIIVVQVILGILTLLGSKGSIPVFYGAIHQGVGILLLTFMIYINIRVKLK
jgi:cytochrome c oxidase assembly protein subunit 15